MYIYICTYICIYIYICVYVICITSYYYHLYMQDVPEKMRVGEDASVLKGAKAMQMRLRLFSCFLFFAGRASKDAGRRICECLERRKGDADESEPTDL